MTYSELFPFFPDDAACWIYVADRPLTDREQQQATASLESFFEEWTSHGRSVEGAATVCDDRFLIVAATLEGDISGCGIDAAVHVVEDVAQQLGFAWLSPLMVFYRDAEGVVQNASRSAFRKLVDEGRVAAGTPVFDASLTQLGQVRGGQFERPAGQSWHARAFRIPTPTP